MANTRKAAKRARQADQRNTRNQIVRSATRTALRSAIDALNSKDVTKAKEAFMQAVRAVSKAASKGSIPKGRASRKISRLTLMFKKHLPAVVQK